MTVGKQQAMRPHPISRQKLPMFMMLGVFLLIALLEMASPIITGSILHNAVVDNNSNLIIQRTGVLVALGLVIGLLNGLSMMLFTRFEVLAIKRVQTHVMNRLFHVALPFFDTFSVGELSHRLLLLKSITRPLRPGQLGALLSFVCSVFCFGVMLFYAWQLTLWILALVSLILFITSWMIVRLLPHQEKNIEEFGNAYRFMYQVVHGISRIQLFAKQKRVESAWNTIYANAYSHLRQVYRWGSFRFTLFASIQFLSLLLLFFITSHGYPSPLPQKSFIIFFAALSQFIGRLIYFYINTNELLPALIAYRRIKPLLQAPMERTSTQPLEVVPTPLVGNIEINHLYFKYPHSKTQIFSDFHCTMTPGQHVALVGLSGSGKSTLIKLLLGFYTPQHGDIVIDGQSINDLDLIAFRRQIGVVFQDSQLFSGSILENLVSHVGATEDEAWSMLSKLGIAPWILSLPMGIHTQVTGHMNLLSGGQKQLLCIARALIGKPRLLLLDEATHSLDNKTQQAIVAFIQQLKITRITITHRLSTLPQVDKIIVLDQGKIIETGTYNALFQQQGFFYRLASLHNN